MNRFVDVEKVREKYGEFWNRSFDHPKYEDTLADIMSDKDVNADNTVQAIFCENCRCSHGDRPDVIWCDIFRSSRPRKFYCGYAIEKEN